METNKTEHFGLNQWALTDPVRAEDFNEDNQVIDAALRTEILGRYAFEPGSTQLDIDLSGFDLSRFAQLECRIVKLTADDTCSVCYRLNGLTTGYVQNDYKYYSSEAMKVTMYQTNEKLYLGTGTLRIFLGYACLVGSYSGFGHNLYNGFYSASKNDYPWGIHHYFLLPQDLNTINLVASAPITGGEVLLIGHRY